MIQNTLLQKRQYWKDIWLWNQTFIVEPQPSHWRTVLILVTNSLKWELENYFPKFLWEVNEIKIKPWNEVREERQFLPSPHLTILTSSPELNNTTLLNFSVYNAVLLTRGTADLWNSFILQNWNFIPLEQQLISPSCQLLLPTNILFAFMMLTTLNTWYKYDYAVFVLWLAYST